MAWLNARSLFTQHQMGTQWEHWGDKGSEERNWPPYLTFRWLRISVPSNRYSPTDESIRDYLYFTTFSAAEINRGSVLRAATAILRQNYFPWHFREMLLISPWFSMIFLSFLSTDVRFGKALTLFFAVQTFGSIKRGTPLQNDCTEQCYKSRQLGKCHT